MSITRATASCMLDDGQLCPIVRLICANIGTKSSACSARGLTATYPMRSPGSDSAFENE